MSTVNDFLKSGADFLKTVSGAATEILAWDGQNLPCVFSERADSDALGLGGLAPDGTRATVLIKTDDFADSTRPGKGDRVTLRGGTWKVEGSRRGDVSVTLDLIDASAREGGGR